MSLSGNSIVKYARILLFASSQAHSQYNALGVYLVMLFALSRRVVKAFTGDLPLTARANFRTRWLRRVPVRRGVVRFFGLPIENRAPVD